MRISKVVVTTLILCLVGVSSINCTSKSSPALEMESQVVIVRRGNIISDIGASGNLELSRNEELAFEIDGTVAEVMVEEGEFVKEGQTLAMLDASEWEDQLTALERQVTTKNRDLLQAKISVKNAELSLENAKDPISTTGRDISVVVIDPLNIEIKELQLELARARLEDAQMAVVDAKKELDDAKNTGPIIVAPFDGFITRVNVDGGDEVQKGTVAVQLADPNRFEADILVGEMDILNIKLGGDSTVQIDAMQALTIPAKVTHISPTATIQQGVVNYGVKVELESLEAVLQEQQRSRQEESQEAALGELPERLRQAIEKGRITQEEAEERMKQMQQAREGRQGQALMTIPEGFQLREGLSVTISIIIDERNNVLLIPSRVIIQQGRNTLVQVLEGGVINERSIKTGISDWQNTEVIDGLSEGEQVVIPQGAATTTTPARQGQSGGIPREMRRMLR